MTSVTYTSIQDLVFHLISSLPSLPDTHHLPSVEHDSALALALQQESKEEALASLEDAGLFFCQICQKDLTAMNTLRREQHVNRSNTSRTSPFHPAPSQPSHEELGAGILQNSLYLYGLN